MTFHDPRLLLWALALIPLAWLWRVIRKHHQKRLAQFADPATWSFLNPHVSKSRRRWKAILLFAALALSVVVAARPLWGTRERMIRGRGVDILVAIDTSDSMLATDVKPTRLEEARKRLRQFLLAFPGQRVGIIPFSGEALLQCPLTTDYGIALNALERLDTNVIATQGTNIGSAIYAAREAFKSGGIGKGVLVLLTDGEDHEGKVLEQAKLAAEEGIVIYSLGIGSAEGAPIVLGDGRFKEDKNGMKVLSRLDTNTLAAIADATGGKSYIARPGESLDVRPLIDDLSEMEKSEFGESKRVIREERYQYPLAIVLILLFAEALITERRGQSRGNKKDLQEAAT